MKKRGEMTLWFLAELAAAVFIVYVAVDLALAYSQGTTFEKQNIARDISMQINTLSSVSGDAYIVNKNLHGYSLRFSGNMVEVFEEGIDTFKETYYFVKIGDSEFDLTLEKPEQVVISKIGNEIKISEDIPTLT